MPIVSAGKECTAQVVSCRAAQTESCNKNIERGSNEG